MIDKIMLDAGHGGKDPGATSHGAREKDIVLNVVLRLGHLLASHLSVEYTRTRDRFLKLSERRKKTNLSGADLFLSVHANAGGGSGYEVYTTRGETAADIYATHLFGAYGKEFPTRIGRPGLGDGDVDKEKNFAVLLCRPPAALFELGFLDTDEGRAFLTDPSNQERMAQALYRGTLGMIGQHEIPPTPPPPSEIVTAIAQAENLLQTLRGMRV